MSKSRVAYATASPYAEPVPEISASVETDLLQLLLPALKLLGESRKRDRSTTKGRGHRRRDKAATEEDTSSKDEVKETDESKQVKIGFNSVVRELETIVIRPRSVPDQNDGGSGTDMTRTGRRPAAVIACPSAIPSPFLNSLQLLVAMASMTGGGSDQPIHLVRVSSQFETAVCKALLLPRVGLMALYEDPQGSKALVNYIRNKVPPLEVPWLEQAHSSTYLPLKLHGIKMPVKHEGTKKRKMAGGSAE